MPRKITLNLAITVDGRIEGPGGDYSWCFDDGNDYGMTDFLAGIDTLLMGRGSYETLVRDQAFHPVFADKTMVVCSRTLDDLPPPARLLKGNAVQAVRALREEPGAGIWLFGGAVFTRAMLDADLVDELQLAVHPLILGPGKSLFDGVERRIDLELADAKVHSTGLVMLIYRRKV
ncbi:MAG: dihydrofolate reductase family protein [Planctomycetota bacterium]